MHPYYKANLNINTKDFQNSTAVYERIASLPIYPDLTDKEIDYIVTSTIEIIRENRR